MSASASRLPEIRHIAGMSLASDANSGFFAVEACDDREHECGAELQPCEARVRSAKSAAPLEISVPAFRKESL
jgi:hypothetical protein